MPVTIKKKGQTGIIRRYRKGDPNRVESKIRYYEPDGGTFDRIYINPGQMTRWREHYKDQGIKSRIIPIVTKTTKT